MKVDEFVSMIRSFGADHTPDGWPAVRMRDVSRLCDIIERQRKALNDIILDNDFRHAGECKSTMIAREELNREV